jgi:predicted lipoprotein with Yx(FWY)xxD motif
MGTVLTDGHGHTLYSLSTEANGQDACTMEPGCALMWPALAPTSNSAPVPGGEVSGALSVITAADGSIEVTYNGWPLHMFSGEPVGQVTGEGASSFGGTWSVATPDMTPISNGGGGSPFAGFATPAGPSALPGALPTNPFAPTTPPGIPAQPTLPAISPIVPTDPAT